MGIKKWTSHLKSSKVDFSLEDAPTNRSKHLLGEIIVEDFSHYMKRPMLGFDLVFLCESEVRREANTGFREFSPFSGLVL